jgi:hypothetical protein
MGLKLSMTGVEVFFFTGNLYVASQEGPHRRGEILGVSWGWHATKTPLDNAEPKRDEEIG